MIIANQTLLQIMCTLPGRQGRKLAPKLKKLVASGIIEENGCWILGAMRGKATDGMIRQYQDRTGCEMQLNDFYLGGYLSKKHRHDFAALQEQGLLLVKALVDILEPHGVFRIIFGLSRCLDPDNPVMTGKVRFHKVRAEDLPWGDDKTLDKEPSSACLVFITDKRPNAGLVSETTWPEFPLP
jgi:hypothetical protein